jgi:glucan-binding YG repeat protein
MATIYEHIRFEKDTKLGFINQDGEIFGYLEDSGEEEFVGRIDYDDSVVYLLDEDEEIAMGWLDDENKIIASFEEEDIVIGYVKENGDLYYYVDDNDAQYIGRVDDMSDPVEGAAALLIFFEFEEEVDDES